MATSEARGVQHSLVIDGGCSDQLDVWAVCRLADVLNGSMGLVTVSRAQLLQNRGAYLLFETKLQDLCLDGLNDGRIVNLHVVEVDDVGRVEGDRPVMQAQEDVSTNLC